MSTHQSHRVALAALLSALSFFSVSCAELYTEVVLVVESEIATEDIDRLDVIITSPGGETTNAAAWFSGDQPDFPRTLTLVQDGETLGPYVASVTARKTGRIVIESESRFTFVRDERRVLRVQLARDCRDVTCGAEQTCRLDGCESIDIELEEFDDSEFSNE